MLEREGSGPPDAGKGFLLFVWKSVWYVRKLETSEFIINNN